MARFPLRVSPSVSASSAAARPLELIGRQLPCTLLALLEVRGSAIREGDWKLIEFHKDGRQELYNLRTDVSETRNLALKESAVVTQLAAKLEKWRRESGAVMPQKNPNADPAWPGWGLTGEEKPTPPVGRI